MLQLGLITYIVMPDNLVFFGAIPDRMVILY
jgi:hypothetical protein